MYLKRIKEVATDLLKEKKVDMIIGFRQGTIPMMNEPFMATTPKEVQHLVWNSHCGNNLATYLVDKKGKIGIVAKGCDSRNIVNHIVESKIQRDQLFIIGVPCKGMVDRRKVALQYDGEIETVEETDDTIIVKGIHGGKNFSKQEVLQDNCRICQHHNPVIYDELVADSVEEIQDIDPFAGVREIESMSIADKREHFEEMFSSCIRCYACRNACPLCYCPTCFVDEARPQWIGKSDDPTDTMTFHFLRAFHCAGRCTDCGACEQACPQEIKVRSLTGKLSKECFELYGWEAGLTPEKRPPLDTFRTDDSEDFIK